MDINSNINSNARAAPLPDKCPMCGWARKDRSRCMNCDHVFTMDAPDRAPDVVLYHPALYVGLLVIAALVIVGSLLARTGPFGMIGGVFVGGTLMTIASRYRRTRGEN